MKSVFWRILRAINLLITGMDIPQGSLLNIEVPPGVVCHVHGIEDPDEIFVLTNGSKFTYPINLPQDLIDNGMSICIDMSLVSEGEEEDIILNSTEINFEN
jgi:hypothetical protein